MYQSSSRGGTRGGRTSFKWDSLKTDKYREFYLGHSLNVPVGRWQKDKNLQWYSEKKNDNTAPSHEEDVASEIKKMKELEMEAFASILSNKYNVRDKKNVVSKDEIKEILKSDVVTDLFAESAVSRRFCGTWTETHGAVKNDESYVFVRSEFGSGENVPNVPTQKKPTSPLSQEIPVDRDSSGVYHHRCRYKHERSGSRDEKRHRRHVHHSKSEGSSKRRHGPSSKHR